MYSCLFLTTKQRRVIEPRIWSDLWIKLICLEITTVRGKYFKLRAIGLKSIVFANCPGNPGWVILTTQKWYSILPCLALSTIKYGSRVKWSDPGKWVAPSPTSRCSSYWKGSFWVILDFTLFYDLIETLRTSRMWHKVNFWVECKAEFRVVILLDWLLYQV